MIVVRRTRVRYFLAFWLFVLSGIAFLDRTNISIAGLQISQEFGLNNQQLGWIFSAFLVGYAVFQIPAGILAARFGPRRVLTFGVWWWGAVTAFTALLPSNISHALVCFLAIRLVLGAGEAVICPASNQFVARWVPQQERGFVNGLIFAGVGVGSGLTPPLLTWIIIQHGWRAAFWFSAVIGFIAGVVWFALARDTPEEHPGVVRAELREIHAGLSVDKSERSFARSDAPYEISWRAIFTRKDLAAMAAAYFSFGYIAWIFFSWFFLYLEQARGFNLRFSARYAMLPFLCMTIFSFVGGWLSDRLTQIYGLRVGRCYFATVSLMITAVFLVIGSQVRSPQLAGIILTGGAGTLYLCQSTFWSVSVDIAGRSAGVFSSIVNMGGQIGGAITVSLTPWIASHFGWTTSFAVSAGMAIVGACCWLVVHPERSLERAEVILDKTYGLQNYPQI